MKSVLEPKNRIHRLLLRLRGKALSRGLATLSIRPEDIFLVSYPRSGNTWARFLLANLLSYKERTPVDFHSVRNIIPDVHIEEQRVFAENLPGPRILKSHSTYNPDYPRVIYLVRDARDVYVSYFHYLAGVGKFQGSFADFMMTRDIPYGLWSEHVVSWLKSPSATNLLLVRYEEILDNARHELARMADFAGITVSDQQLEYSVQQSSYRQMRRIEDSRGRPYGDRNTRFVRKGMTGTWRDHFSESSKDVLRSRAHDLLLELGYVESEKW